MPLEKHCDVLSKLFNGHGVSEDVSRIVFQANGLNDKSALFNELLEVMVFDVDMLGLWLNLVSIGYFDGTTIVFKDLAFSLVQY